MTDAVQPAAATKPPARPNPLVGPAILLVWIGIGAWVVASPSGPGVFAFVMVGWILAVMLHEFSHAAVAWLAGDHTVAEKGYLSFDPRRYGDLGTSLVIPLLALMLGGVGFPGGAVYLRNDLMRSPAWRTAASLAGPAATLAILLVMSFGLSFWGGWGIESQGQMALFEALTVIAFLQAMALILNLLPIPGLDGFNAIRPFLPAAWAPAIHKAEGLALLAILVLIFVIPGASAALFTASAVLGRLMGLDLQALQDGWRAFHFWN
jgi:Zn-dependent protease